jgi:hypothetical protein
MGLVPSTFRRPPNTTMRLRELRTVSAINPASANGSTSGHSAAK